MQEYLGTAASPEERRDREVLLAHVLRCDRARLYAHPEQEVLDHPVLDALLERRARHEPVAYLTGHRAFWSMDLTVTRDVLVPRVETELVVELALARLADTGRVLDLGTGSGAIALAIARERPGLTVSASDVSAEALVVARANGARHGIVVEWLQRDWLTGIGGTFDVIVANPPYVADADPHLAALCWEPRLALVAGADGLTALQRIVREAPARIVTGGWLLVEHGCDQGARVRELFRAAGFVDVTTHCDLAGLERATAGKR